MCASQASASAVAAQRFGRFILGDLWLVEDDRPLGLVRFRKEIPSGDQRALLAFDKDLDWADQIRSWWPVAAPRAGWGPRARSTLQDKPLEVCGNADRQRSPARLASAAVRTWMQILAVCLSGVKFDSICSCGWM